MASPYVGEIRVFGFPFAPHNYMACNGQTLSISQYTALFSIIGTAYGGNGQTTFNLPNLQNSVPMHWGNGAGLSPRTLGEVVGTENVTLTIQQIPNHTHMVNSADTTVPAQKTGVPGPTAYIGPSTPANAYITTGTPGAAFSPRMISQSGSSLPHNNIQPVLAVNYCIAVFGTFPAHN